MHGPGVKLERGGRRRAVLLPARERMAILVRAPPRGPCLLVPDGRVCVVGRRCQRDTRDRPLGPC